MKGISINLAFSLLLLSFFSFQLKNLFYKAPSLLKRNLYNGNTILFSLSPIFFLSIDAGESKNIKDSPYNILGIDSSATLQQIKSSYRELTKKYHPDRNSDPGAVDTFSKIREAYDILSDDQKRQIFDSEGYEGLERYEKYGNSQPFDPTDIFGDIFGFKQRPQTIEKAKPIILTLSVTLEDLYFGKTLRMKYKHKKLCDKLDSCLSKDEQCSGKGVRSVTQRLGPGFIVKNNIQDETCISNGKSMKKNCKACPEGVRTTATSTISIFIEPGLNTGDTIIFEGKGEEQIGAQNGDLIFNIKSIEHERFVRNGDDLEVTTEIPLRDALIGFEKKIMNIDNTFININNPDVTFDGKVIKYPKRGMPKKDSHSFGDLYLKFKIIYPTVLNDHQKELIKNALPNN